LSSLSCFAGWSALASTMRRGTTRHFPRIASALLEGDIAAKLLSAVIAQPRVERLLNPDHFSVDGALIEAWASMKGFRAKDGSNEPPVPGGRNREADFHGPEARRRHTRLDDRLAPTLSQGTGQGGETMLHQACVDGEPQRPRRRRRSDRGQRPCRAVSRRCTCSSGHLI
jgi:hypothetical protein